jgi:LPS-assembly protein
MNKFLKYSLLLSLFSSSAFAATDSAKLQKEISTEASKIISENPEEISKAKEEVKDKSSELLEKAVIEADVLTFDKETKTLLAEGNVVLGYDGREIKAKKIEYNQATRMITADDGVQYKDKSGTIFKAKNIKVTDSFNKGTMKDVKADFGDGSSFESENLTILDVNKYNLQHSTYSPCKPCADGKYLWQFDADKIVYNEEDGRVYYRDTYLKVFGKKIAWIPVISHPTPFAKSKSGFLTPKFGRNSKYGFYTSIPYYYQPKENMDFTFKPLLTVGDGPVLTTEMRHLTTKGTYELEVSGAYPEEFDSFGNSISGAGRKFRGHAKGKGNFKFLDNWNYGFDFARATDDTYLRRYDLGSYEDVLKSEAYVNRVRDRNYLQVKTLAFQGLRENDDPAISPVAVPQIEGRRVFDISDNYNQKLETDFNSLVLRRDVGADSSRAIGSGKWRSNFTTSSGHIINLKLGARADYYNVSNVSYLGSQYTGDVSRLIPSTSLTWSYPLQKIRETYGLVLEPIAMFVASTNSNNTQKISNEDSQNIELSDYNLFQENHISGYDLVESGMRTNYGMRGILTTEKLGDYNFLVGQNYRAKKEPRVFLESSGMADNFSDYVGRISTGTSKVQTNYRFMLDKDSYRFKRNEVGVNLNFDAAQFSTGYAFIDGDTTRPDRQEVNTIGKLKLTDSVNFLANARRNLDNDESSGWVNVGGGLEFSTDCITTSVEINREFTRDRDIQPSTDIIFKVTLANFGN